MATTGSKPPADISAAQIIQVDDEAVDVSWHFDDMLGFAVFWVLAIVVFLQFFSRYILNDSAAWTEEIARYLLMLLTFIGAAIVSRRGTHIAVEAVLHFLPTAPQRILRFIIDAVTLGFVGLLCWFSIAITQRMHMQRMTVIEWPMSIVYGGIAIGCFLMLWRTIQAVAANARRGWRPDPAAATLIMD